MFAIDTPQTIELFGLKPADGKETPSDGSITFQHETEDVSKCQMIVRIEDRVYTYTFGTRGPIVETTYEDDETREAAEEACRQTEADEAHRREVEQEHRREVEQEHAHDANARELRTADDTTAADVAFDAPHPAQVDDPRLPPLEEAHG